MRRKQDRPARPGRSLSRSPCPSPAPSHRASTGRVRMVDVSAKRPTARTAVASGSVTVSPHTLRLIASGGLFKGDVLSAARLAGISAAKRTGDLIPLCHALPLEWVEVEFAIRPPGHIHIRGTARTVAKTGVEMEALTAVTVAALTIYDMCKSADKAITLGPFHLESKTGGKSGPYRRHRASDQGHQNKPPDDRE
jgi:cyclic pyranopterin phosphate synthase